ncbi:MAG: hypothetical protein NZ853_11325, partial [Leptospiraceae bacterium]|nr:hypothetical protein [Leptospiraceae bacterium]
ELILDFPVKIIGINHRDLDTLKINTRLSFELTPIIRKSRPDILIVAESGIEDPNLLKELSNVVDGFLIGTYFLKNQDIKQAWENLFAKLTFSYQLC